jgi:archaellum biogenesis ATPase FlaH
MMKTLISSFFTFLLIYIQGWRSLNCRKFFSKILKCVRNITKNVITTDSFAAKVVIVIDNMWKDMILILDTGCVTFNLVCVFVVNNRSSTAFSFGRFRSICIAIPFLHLRFAGILTSYLCGFSHVRFVIN